MSSFKWVRESRSDAHHINMVKKEFRRLPLTINACVRSLHRTLTNFEYDTRSLGGCRRLFDQRNHSRINPRIVLSTRHIHKQPPPLHMLHDFPRFQFDQRPQRFQLDEVRVGEHFEIAAEIGILRATDDRRAFNEEITFPEISSPAGRVVYAAHLLLESALGIRKMPKLDIARAEYPARVGKVRVGPDAFMVATACGQNSEPPVFPASSLTSWSRFSPLRNP